MSDSATLWTVAHQALLSWESPGKNTGVGYHALFQGIFPTQGWNLRHLCLLHWQVGSLPLAPRGRSHVESSGHLKEATYCWVLSPGIRSLVVSYRASVNLIYSQPGLEPLFGEICKSAGDREKGVIYPFWRNTFHFVLHILVQCFHFTPKNGTQKSHGIPKLIQQLKHSLI